MPTEPEWLEWTVKVIVPAITGVVGGIVGVAIGAQLTTRRERWNLRREIYCDLLKATFDLAIRHLDVRRAVEAISGARPDLIQQKLDEARAKFDAVQEAVLTYGRAKAVARLIVPAQISRLLDEAAAATTAAVEINDLKIAGEQLERVLPRILKELERAAREDLFGMSGWYPLEEITKEGQR